MKIYTDQHYAKYGIKRTPFAMMSEAERDTLMSVPMYLPLITDEGERWFLWRPEGTLEVIS